ncbi:MAG: hydroxymethylbilane synthase [Caldilineaceae bacterium]|nr:hydroxymethylbilane synthase [Caldilineaceae bacterium]MDE0337772.1 hydroxymethylbilane synthase [Caldilineaceae bacterium]
MFTPRHIRLGSRGSALALWQTEHVASRLRALHPDVTVETVVIQTRGDRFKDRPLPSIGGKGLFTMELEERLRQGQIDGAVHSLKDLPVVDPEGLVLGAMPARGDVADALVLKDAGETRERPRNDLSELREGAVVGTGSRRRAAQLLARRPDLRIMDIRGNVDTRVRKTLDPAGEFDAAVLAVAGLKRLGLAARISFTLPFETMLPAPGQGALAVQCRQEAKWLGFFGGIDDKETRAAVTAERAFLAELGGGCRASVGALGECSKNGSDRRSLKDLRGESDLRLWGRVSAPDGSRQIDARIGGSPGEAEQLGRDLAQQVLRRGAKEILEQINEIEVKPDENRQR